MPAGEVRPYLVAGVSRSKRWRPPLPTSPESRARQKLAAAERSFRQEGRDGGGAWRGHSPPRARLPWTRSTTAVTSQVGRDGEDRAAARPRAPASRGGLRQDPAPESPLSVSVPCWEVPSCRLWCTGEEGRDWSLGEGTLKGISSGPRRIFAVCQGGDTSFKGDCQELSISSSTGDRNCL